MKMLSERLYAYLDWLGPLSHKLGCSLYTWDPLQRIFVKPKTLNEVSKAAAKNGLLIFLQFFCLVYQLVRTYIAKRYEESIFVLGVTLGLVFFIWTLMLTLLLAEDWFLMLNTHLVFFRNWQSKPVTK